MNTVLKFRTPVPAGTDKESGQDRILRALIFCTEVAASVDTSITRDENGKADTNTPEVIRWQKEMIKVFSSKSSDELYLLGHDLEHLGDLVIALLNGVGLFGLTAMRAKSARLMESSLV